MIVVIIQCIEHGFPYLGSAGNFQIVGGTTFSASPQPEAYCHPSLIVDRPSMSS